MGLGLIGGSLALALRSTRPGTLVLGIDSEQGVVSEALQRGLVDAGSTELEAAADADLVVLAAPVRANIAAIPTLLRIASPGAALTDVGSTKRAIVQAARAAGGGERFVGGHPLAGAASGGLSLASRDLFTGRKWVFTPDDGCPGEILAGLKEFVVSLGAVPCVMTAAEHDRIVAVVSHLPQLAASALMEVVGEMSGDDGLALAGAGLADTTRLASSPAGIWRDVCATNADAIGPALLRYVEVLDALLRDLPSGERLERVFNDARAWRDRLAAPGP